MAFTWHGKQSSAGSCNFGSLAVVTPLLERMNVASIINQHLPADPQAEFDHGAILTLLIAARLYHPIALMNVATWASESGAEILWGIPPEKLNDDRLGKSLDAFFTQRHSILASLALHVAHAFKVPLAEVHYDPTHLVLHGEYAASQAREQPSADVTLSDDDLAPAHITRGRPMSDAPSDVKLIHVGLATVVDEWGPMPIFGHTIDGNHNGHTAVADYLKLAQKHLRPAELTVISDRGTFSAGHLLRLADSGFDAICAVPWKDYQTLFDEHRAKLAWKPASYLSIEQQRRRTQGNMPWEQYQCAEVPHTLIESESKRTIACRVIFVHSTADAKVTRKAREKAVAKLQAGLEKLQRSVAEGRRNSDPTSIARRVADLFGQRQAARYFRYEMIPLEEAERAPGTPKPGCKRATHRFEFSYDAAAAEQDSIYDGHSALVATVPETMGTDEIFTKYKQQCYSELANHEFKTPLAVHPVFLKSAHRVEALACLMLIALMLYFLLQRCYRQNVPANATKQEKRTTTQAILRAFNRYTLLLNYSKLGREVQTTRLTTRQREILQCLGFSTPAQVLSRRLPCRPP